MTIQRSAKAKYAKSLFYHHVNEIDVFIEDTTVDAKIAFERLFQRSPKFSGQVRRIFPCGCKDKVIEKWESSRALKRKRLFIVDGDFDIWDGRLSSKPGLYVLPMYCYENMLIEESAVLKIIQNEKPIEIEKLKSIAKVSIWLQKEAKRLFPLFIEYYKCKRRGHEVNVKNGIHPLLHQGKYSPSKVAQQIKTYRQINKGRFSRAEIDQILENIQCHSPEKIVCGKTHLLPLLALHIKEKCKVKNKSHESWKVCLAEYCSIDVIEDAYSYVL